MNFYQEQLRDHFHHSPYRQELVEPDFSSGSMNPSCGDRIMLQGRLAEGILIQVAFTGSGCVISQAAASLLAQAAHGKSINEIQSFDASFMRSLLGISLGPTRLRCALLALEALDQGLATCLTDPK